MKLLLSVESKDKATSMADFREFVSAVREQMNATLTRSDALRPLIWPLGICAISMTFSAFHGSSWLTYALGAMFFVALSLYLVAYYYCLLKNPDALRSESYNVQKMALERGIYGDSQTGIFEGGFEEANTPSISTPKRIAKK